MKCLACDFGGSSVKTALVDQDANLIEPGKQKAPLGSVEEFIDTVGRLYDRSRNDIDGIAISIPGYIDPTTGYLTGSGVYRALYDHSIVDLLKDRCPVNIAVENDGKCGALAEAWKGALADCVDGAVIILGSGIGGGIIKNKRIHSGRGFTAGELSYLIAKTGDYSIINCAYMQAGMLGMTYKLCKAKRLDLSIQDSGDVLEWLDEQMHPGSSRSNVGLGNVKADGVQLFRWLEEGDEAANRVYREFITALTAIVHNTQILYGPENIAIGGGLSLQGRVFTDLDAELNKCYESMGIPKALRAVVVKSRYLEECNLVGAMYNYLNRFAQNPGIESSR
jgi:predicted NBD/HSP70 family sugar kinase